ncbi:oleate hydratase, partial [Escherichia coli]
QYDAIVRPMEQWLKQQGVVFEYGTKVEDVDFVETGDGRRIGLLRVVRGGQPMAYDVRQEDLVLITIGSMTADA